VSLLRERPGPHPRTWLALGVLVLLAHAAPLLDWGALWALAASPERAGASSAASRSPNTLSPSTTAPKPPSTVVRVAQVRWIAADAALSAPERPAEPPTKAAQRPVPKAPTPVRAPSKPQPAPLPSPLTEPGRPAEPAVVAESEAQATDASEATPPPVATATPSPTPTETLAPTPASANAGAEPPIDARLQPAPTRPTLLPGNRWLRYDVTGQSKGEDHRASGEIRWQTSEGRYQANFKISKLFFELRSQQSTGRLTDTGLVPERFADKRRSERAAHFEPEQGRIRFSNNAPDAPWLPGTQDRLSVFFQLAAWLNARPDGLREGQRLSLPVAGTSGADQWQLLVQALEPLDLPAGRWDALRVEVVPQKIFDQRIELWLAPQLDHLPVRIRLTESNGDVLDLQLSALP